jgi:multidrug resistance efflux pump
VQEGQTVLRGEVLLVLSSVAVEGQVRQAEAAVEAAEADLALASAAPSPETQAAMRAQLRLAEGEAAAASGRLQSAQAQRANPQSLRGQILEAQTQLNLALRAVEAAEADEQRAAYERDQAAYASSEQRGLAFTADANGAALAAARDEQQAAAVALKGLRAIEANPIALDAAVHGAAGESAVAEAGVRVAEARLQDVLAGPQPSEVALARAHLDLAHAQLSLARAQASRLLLRAPGEGVVLEQIAQAGESVVPAMSLLILGDLRHVTVRVFVPEPRIGEVCTGQRASVTVDSYPGRQFLGTVSRIAERAEYTPRNVATREGRQNTFYSVEIAVDNEDLALKPGMPADVSFLPESSPG